MISRAFLPDLPAASRGRTHFVLALGILLSFPACGENDFAGDVILPEENPLPVLETVTPLAVELDGQPTTFTVTGSDFVQQSVILWDGEDVTTFFVNAEELQATLDSMALGGEGEHTIAVRTPPPGGGLSRQETVTVVGVDEEIDVDGTDQDGPTM